MKLRYKRIISLLVALVMLCGMMPMTVFAAEEIEANPWSGRSAVFVGDSITAGSGTTKIYYSFLKEALGFDSVTAMGVGGSCISAASDYGAGNQPLINRYQNIPSTDLIVIFMGTNDYGHETPLGSVEDTQDGTFYGALNTIIPALVAKHTSSKIVFVTPLHRYGFGTSKILGTQFTYDNIPNGVGATLGDYVDALKTVCANNGVSVIDLHTECTLDPSDAAVRSTYMPDGLHPNASGHEVIAGIMESHIRTFEPAEAPETDPTEPTEPAAQTELVYGNRFASGFSQQNRASSRVNYYLKAGTVITLKDPASFQWACARSSDENSSSNLGYFPDSGWSDKETAVVAEDGWVGFTFKYRDESQSFDLTKLLSDYISIEEPHVHSYTSTVTAPTCTEQGYTTYTCACGDSYANDYVNATGHKRTNGICTVCGDSFAGKKVSILSHSMSTYVGVSNSTAANSTIGNNDVYYTEGRLGVYQKDTWWQQVIDALDMELLVNNSWSGSCVFMPRKGEASVGYGDRAVNLHNDHTGEDPDIIFVYLGCNDFAYFKDTFGTADSVDYDAIILDNGDGTYTYAQPTNTCEAYAIMLHKVNNRYPDAEIYCMTSTARREIDYTGDTYPDAGQPTAYSAELQKVAQYFGYPVIDLENAIPKEVELFDKYIGDKRAHANALGMDQISNEVLSVMLGRNAEICHVTADNGAVAEQAVLLGGSYTAKVNIPQGYSVVVTMGGKDVTTGAYKDGRIVITEVTGGIHVEIVINRDPQNFRWEFQNGILTSVGSSENVLTKLSGTVANNILNDGIFQLDTPVVLKHDLPWAVEWKCAEDWRGAMLVTHKESATKGMTFLTRTKGGQLCFGTYTGSQYDNYGIDVSDLNANTHTYRLENRITADRSNMIWLYVDGEEIGPMNNYFIGSKDQNKTSNWVSGKDFVFSFIGMTGHALRNCQLDYISVTECVHTYENGICTGCGEAQPGPVITQQPVDGEAKLGERYCVTVEAEGEGLTYQWYLRNAGSSKWYKSSVKDNTYDDVMTSTRAGREVYCVITDANGNSVKTDIVKLVLLPSEELAIVTQPTDGEAALGERYCVTVEAKGEGLKYQWYFRNKGATRWTKSSVTDSTYDDVMNNTRNGREVYCVITDKFGNSVTTDTVKLVRVPMKLEITSQPADATAAFGEMFCATAVAKGEGLKYQWYYRNAGSTKWYRSGVRDNTYDDVMTKARAGREVYCVITDKYGNSVTTDTVKLIAVPSVELKLLGMTYEAAAHGERYCVTVEAEGEGLTYTWYFRNAGATRWSKSSVRDNTYDDVMNRTRANREVYCVITDAFGNTVTTETVTLVCTDIPRAIAMN